MFIGVSRSGFQDSLSLRQLTCSTERSSRFRSPRCHDVATTGGASVGTPTVESRCPPPRGSSACSAASSRGRHARPTPEWRVQAPPASPDASKTYGEACAGRCSPVRRTGLGAERSPGPPPRSTGMNRHPDRAPVARGGTDAPEVRQRAVLSMARTAVGRLSATRSDAISRCQGPGELCRSALTRRGSVLLYTCLSADVASVF